MVTGSETGRQRPDIEVIWGWLKEVADPEIPVISVVDLGIVRDVFFEEGDNESQLVVKVTPTYSGCPATRVITQDIERALAVHGMVKARVEMQLFPAWTTDWMSDDGRERLREFGIAPPETSAAGGCGIAAILGSLSVTVKCPRCGSSETKRVSEFGSTPCKAHFTCESCLEPFDYFKPI